MTISEADGTKNRGEKPEEVTKTLRDLFEVNVIANVHLFNLFIPLILKGGAKKVIVISSGFADTEFTNKYDVTPGSLYSASKAAINMIISKYSAQYKEEGVLFLALCPGMVEVGHYKDGMIHSCPFGQPSALLTCHSVSQRPRRTFRAWED